MGKIVTYYLKSNSELTPEEKRRISEEIAEMKKHPIVFDEDCPELSPAMMKAFKCVVAQRNRRNMQQ